MSFDHVAPATILLVDDDRSVLEVFRRALEPTGSTVFTSTTGQAAIDRLRQRVDLAIVDLKLPDMSGIDVVRRTKDEHPYPFILVSGFLTIELCVQAMRLGAFDVLEKPVTAQRVLTAVQACLRNADGHDRLSREPSEAIHLSQTDGPPGSAAHRWAMYVRKACESGGDLRTLEDWARCAGVSYSTLCESCRLIGIQPHAARDFTRALRAMIKSSAYRCDPSVLLDVSDRRTLKLLLERAGPFFGPGGGTSAPEFIRHQLFVPISNAGIRVLLGNFEQPERGDVRS